MRKPGFLTHHPDALTSSVVFAAPHSGRDYSAIFLRRSELDNKLIRSSEDAFVDLLIEQAPKFGAPLLVASVPRAFVDLNRSETELDPALIEGVQKSGHNPRIASGLGVIPRVVANGRNIYRGKLSMLEAERRLRDFWHPYHTEVSALLQDAHRHFGEAILVDFHSMPREALNGSTRRGEPRPQIVLGDRFGASTATRITEQVEAAFAAVGFVVARNAPFAGAYITQRYGRPMRDQHAIQIEIDRSIYMHEDTLEPNADFEMVREMLSHVLKEIAAIGRGQDVALAAE